MELVLLRCNRNLNQLHPTNYWYKHAIATQRYQNPTTDEWWFSLHVLVLDFCSVWQSMPLLHCKMHTNRDFATWLFFRNCFDEPNPKPDSCHQTTSKIIYLSLPNFALAPFVCSVMCIQITNVESVEHFIDYRGIYHAEKSTADESPVTHLRISLSYRPHKCWQCV